MSFTALDWIAVGVYFSVLLDIAVWGTRHHQRTGNDYFLAGRHATR